MHELQEKDKAKYGGNVTKNISFALMQSKNAMNVDELSKGDEMDDLRKIY